MPEKPIRHRSHYPSPFGVHAGILRKMLMFSFSEFLVPVHPCLPWTAGVFFLFLSFLPWWRERLCLSKCLFTLVSAHIKWTVTMYHSRNMHPITWNWVKLCMNLIDFSQFHHIVFQEFTFNLFYMTHLLGCPVPLCFVLQRFSKGLFSLEEKGCGTHPQSLIPFFGTFMLTQLPYHTLSFLPHTQQFMLASTLATGYNW